MKTGQTVNYRDAAGTVSEAVVTDITESGPSGCKVLDLKVGEIEAKKVPHFKDDAGEGCWGLTSETIPTPVEAAVTPKRKR
jgi:hypothetical protein